MGRNKIEIVEIQDRNKRHVSFSKRRAGLFKKAKEISTLCGADVAVLVFSAAGKLYISNSPHSTKTIIHRYLAKSGDSPPAVDEHQLLDNKRSHVDVDEKKIQLGGAMKCVDIEAINDLDELEDVQKRLNKRRAMLLAQAKQQPFSSPSAPSQEMMDLVYDEDFTRAMLDLSQISSDFVPYFLFSPFFIGFDLFSLRLHSLMGLKQ